MPKNDKNPAPTKHPQRGQVYNITKGLTTTTGTEIWPGRPAVIVSNDAINQKAGFVTVVYLTTAPKRHMPYHASVNCGGREATALCEQIFSVDKSRLEFYVDTLSDDEMAEVDKAIRLSTATIGGSKESCVAVFRKWLLAMEKHGIDISGNPASDMPVMGTDVMEQVCRELGLCQATIRELIECVKPE